MTLHLGQLDPNAGGDREYAEIQHWIGRRDEIKGQIAAAQERVAANQSAVDAALERYDTERDMLDTIDKRILAVEGELDELAWSEPILKGGEVIPAAAKISARLTALRDARRAQEDAIREAGRLRNQAIGASESAAVIVRDGPARLAAVEDQLSTYGFLRRVPQSWAHRISNLLDRAGVE